MRPSERQAPCDAARLFAPLVLLAVLAACTPTPKTDPLAPRNLSVAELSEASAWDLFKGDKYVLTSLRITSWECDDCDFDEDGALKECRDCRPIPFERTWEARRQLEPSQPRQPRQPSQPPQPPQEDGDDATSLKPDGQRFHDFTVQRLGGR